MKEVQSRPAFVTVSVWAPNQSGVPDVPHAAIRLITTECAEGSGVGFKKEPPVLLSETGILNSINSDLKVCGKVSIRFLFYVADSVVNQWEATLYPTCIILCAPPKIAINGAKSSFVAMIEFIQEKLNCTNIYLEVQKDQQNFTTLVRTFFYFGFAIVPPGTTPFPVSPRAVLMRFVDV
ncbi:ornithine decarboxylase antizyme [Trichuris suis]|nr:ornithine decarboxylase antizyme [Trichuris suis]